MKRFAYFVVTAFLVAVSCTNDEEFPVVMEQSRNYVPAVKFDKLFTDVETRGGIIDDDDSLYYSLEDDADEELSIIGIYSTAVSGSPRIMTYTLEDIVGTQSTDYLAELCSMHSHDTLRAYFPSPQSSDYTGSNRDIAFHRDYSHQHQNSRSVMPLDRVFWISEPLSFGYWGEDSTGLVMHPMDAVLRLQVVLNDTQKRYIDSICIHSYPGYYTLAQDVWCFPCWNQNEPLAYETMGNKLTLTFPSNAVYQKKGSPDIYAHFALLAKLQPAHQSSNMLSVTAYTRNGYVYGSSTYIQLPTLVKGCVYDRQITLSRLIN